MLLKLIFSISYYPKIFNIYNIIINLQIKNWAKLNLRAMLD